MRARVAVVGVALATLVLSTGPLFRARSWWGYTDPLEADAWVIGARVLVGLAGLAGLAVGMHRLADRRTLAALGALIAWLALSTAWSIRPAVTFRESMLVGAALLAGLGATAALSPCVVRWGAWIGLHVGLAWSAIAIARVAPGTQDELGSWTGVFFNRNSLALVAALGVLVALMTAVETWRARGGERWSVVPSMVAIAAVPADLLLIVRSKSLTPLLALTVAGVAVVGLGVLGRRVVRRGFRSSWVVLVTGITIAAVGVVGWLVRSAVATALGRDASLSGRAEVWSVAWDWFARRPLIGHGYLAPGATVEFQYAAWEASGMVLTSAHSSGLDVLAGTGAIGGVLTVVALGFVSATIAHRAVTGTSTVTWWPVALVAFVLVENSVETLLVGGNVSVAALGLALGPTCGDQGQR